MSRPPFVPTARQTNWLLIVGFVSIGYALYLRYLAVETPTVGLACDAGLATWLCATRRIVMVLFNHSVFGGLALALALLNLVRPSMVLLVPALAAAGFGIVLYNVGLSALAIAVLILCFARPRAAEGSL
jgi:hypothetical protein